MYHTRGRITQSSISNQKMSRWQWYVYLSPLHQCLYFTSRHLKAFSLCIILMKQDLKNGKWEDALFCASLRARDTNRIASVGTIMQLLDTDDRSIIGAKTWPGDELTLNRVVAKCRAVGVAEILWIEECDYGEDDYLIANVRIYNDKETTSTVNERSDEFDSIAQQIIDDYQKVRSIYINSQSLASNELPKFARNSVQTLPTFDHEIVHNEMKIWMLVETWQMLCNTIRQSKRSRLQAVVNELSVAAAMQAKGPLELPVKRNSLPLDLQKQLDDLEQNASRDYLELGMEPVLDFQEIICMKRHVDRVMKLASMIQRERLRLEAKESLIQAFLEMELGEELMSGNYSRDSGKNAFD